MVDDVSQQWYATDGKKTFGPYSFEAFKELAARGSIKPHAQVKLGAEGVPVSAGTVPGLCPKSHWFYLDSRGKEVGPLDIESLREHAQDGLVSKATPLRDAASGEWITAALIPSLVTSSMELPSGWLSTQPAAEKFPKSTARGNAKDRSSVYALLWIVNVVGMVVAAAIGGDVFMIVALNSAAGCGICFLIATVLEKPVILAFLVGFALGPLIGALVVLALEKESVS